MTFTHAVAYLRVSTEQQADSGLGIEAQRASIAAAAVRLGLTVRAWFTDAGVHGDRPLANRHGSTQAVAALRRGDVLLVAKRDRLARDRFEMAVLDRLLKKRGARIVSAAGEGTDDDDPASLLLRGLIDLFAEYERLVIAARTKAALAAKRARGECAGQLPFGFHLAGDGPRVHARGCQTRTVPVESCRCGGRVVQLEPDAGEQDKIARIHALKATGLSAQKIAATLNARGLLTRQGVPWRQQYVARVLKSA